MIISKIAFRNIFRSKRRSLLTGMMMAGGCALFAVTIGMIDGSYGDLIDMFTRDRTGHVQVHKNGYLDRPSIYKILNNPDFIGNKIEHLAHVESWAPRVYTPALAFAGKKTTGVRVAGIHPVREVRTTRLRHKVEKGRFISDAPLDEVIISNGLARVLRVGLGNEIALIAQGVDGSVANGLFKVAGIMGKSEGSSVASICYMHIITVQKFLSIDRGVHEIAVVLTDHPKTMKAVELISDALDEPSFDVEPWQVVESQFYRAMQADVKGNRWTIAVLTIVVAIGVFNTVLMVILERTREFGVLRALGTRPSQVFMLIVLETTYLSIISIIVGTVAGMLANWWFSVYGITLSTPLEFGGFLFDKITAQITIRSILMPAAIIFGTAVVVSIWPAGRAAWVIPVKALRTG
ncbi:MAG: ABC transporter permease [Desulfobacter sp.]|nr:ABC transporter permease [Desulfobacter sp.]